MTENTILASRLTNVTGRNALRTLLLELTAIAVQAARIIVRHDPRTVETRMKVDRSPLTAADLEAEAVIMDALNDLAPDVPVVSEERPFDPASLTAERFFVVDPLDGTREFLAGTGEYSVCIALMAGGHPAAGVIAAPALGILWRGAIGCGAEKLNFQHGFDAPLPAPVPIAIRKPASKPRTVITSRSHLDAKTAAFVGALTETRHVACGSALKFARLAEGAADVYPRLSPVSQWDVAAGDAILTAAGGCVTTPDGQPLAYCGTGQGILVPSFIAWGDPALIPELAVRD